MKGQATVHSTLLAVHVYARAHVCARVCVCVCVGRHASGFFWVEGGRGRDYCHQIYVACNSNKQECSTCTSNDYYFINKNPQK